MTRTKQHLLLLRMSTYKRFTRVFRPALKSIEACVFMVRILFLRAIECTQGLKDWLNSSETLAQDLAGLSGNRVGAPTVRWSLMRNDGVGCVAEACRKFKTSERDVLLDSGPNVSIFFHMMVPVCQSEEQEQSQMRLCRGLGCTSAKGAELRISKVGSGKQRLQRLLP